MPVEIIHFNPPRMRAARLLGPLSGPRLNNFGDLIGPALVRRIVADLGLREPSRSHRLLSVGSILKLAQPGDTVWGSGVNGKSMAVGAARSLDVRAVRGPRTQAVLQDAGAKVPPVFGDPALLWSRYWPRAHYREGGPDLGTIVIPNYNDLAGHRGDTRVVSPLGDPHSVIGKIARSSFVCGSSLHGIVLAESVGIPARLISSAHEPAFKYADYYEATGRSGFRPAASVAEALDLGGEDSAYFDADALVDAFPADLWSER